jgi:predicted dehydrogenase
METEGSLDPPHHRGGGRGPERRTDLRLWRRPASALREVGDDEVDIERDQALAVPGGSARLATESPHSPNPDRPFGPAQADGVIRAAILGTGWIAREHALALASLPGVTVAAVGSSDRGRAERFAREHGIPLAVTPHLDSILRSDIEVVHVCTRTALHAELCATALEAGKHVIAEKPLAASSAETARLLALAERAPRLVAVCNYNYRAYPMMGQARRLVEQGELGELLFVHGSYTQDWLLDPRDYNWRLDPRESGVSGAFGDIGSHWFDLVEHVSGQRIVQLSAYLHTAVTKRTPDGFSHPTTIELDDCGVASFRLTGGAVGTVAISQVSAGRKNRLWFELDGSNGSLAWSQEDPDHLWLGRRHGPSQTWSRGPETAVDDVLPPGHPFGWRDAFRRNLASAYVRIQHPESEPPVPVAGFADGHRGLVLVEAVVRSSAEGRTVSLPVAARADGAASRT